MRWTFEPLYNSPSEWNVTARWMDYQPAKSPPYDILDAMLIADEVRWRAAELIALLHAKSGSLERSRRVLTLADGLFWLGKAISTPRYVNAGSSRTAISEGTEADCRRLSDLTAQLNARLRAATDSSGAIDPDIARTRIASLVELGELARVLYMRWYAEAGYGVEPQ